MNLNFGRTDRTNQEMDSSLTASLLLLSVVFMQFVSAADQNNAPIKAEPGDNVVLTCKDPDQGKIKIAEWKRTDLGSSGSVLLYKDDQLDPGAQHPSYRDRVDLLCNQIMKGDVSLLLKNTTTDDSGTYECRIDTEKLEGKLISTVSLQVSPPPPPEPFPVWAKVLLVLLVLALVAAAGVSVYFWFRWKPVQQVKVKSGEESVLLPLKVPHRLWFCKYRIFLSVDKVEWRDGDNRTVHVYQNGSDQPGQQDKIYRTRTKMDENLLKTKNLSLTLRQPTYGDRGIFTCRVYSRKGHVLMKKRVKLKVKGQWFKCTFRGQAEELTHQNRASEVQNLQLVLEHSGSLFSSRTSWSSSSINPSRTQSFMSMWTEGCPD
ncbi:uncharacterized protein LOC103132797, partial [Poecilia formosa]|uniref:uncharacterized protein LOC103132797 n=1 Tax=Poecilia formosa TaxID=48698 RepID=UPI0007B8973C